MEAATEQGRSEAEREEEKDPRVAAARTRAGGDKAREMVEHAAQGAELDEDEEKLALDYLLGQRPPIVHDITVQYETPRGLVPLTFVVKTVDARKLDKIEQDHTDPTTLQLDRMTANSEIVAECSTALKDKDREVDLRSPEFLTVRRRNSRGEEESFTHASPALALDERFRDQLGLLQGVAMEIRRIAGFSTERVGRAQRRMVTASLG